MKRGFTYLELIVALALLSLLAAAALPSSRKIVKRQKENQLRHQLTQIRSAIDRFKRMADASEIQVDDLDQLGYPADFDELEQGVPLTGKPGQHMRFLRRIPVDPMTGEAKWGMRSVQDDFDASNWGGENLFDVYSLSDGRGLDGTEYATW